MTPLKIFLLIIVVPILCAVTGAVVTHTVGEELTTRDWSDISLKIGMFVGGFASLLTVIFGETSYWDEHVSKAAIGVYLIALFGVLMAAQYLTSCAFGKC